MKTVKRREVIKAIAEARAHGDLRENAEYESAKAAQHNLEMRISQLETQLSDVAIIDDTHMDKDKAFLGAILHLKELGKGTDLKYMLVSKEEADLKAGKISTESPVGRQLLGKKAGDVVEVAIPAGKMRYKILKIER